jgi:NADPH oxidase 1
MVQAIVLFSGVAPFVSVLKNIWYRQKKGEHGSLRRVEFFWVCRDARSFGWFQNLLQEIDAAQTDCRLTFFSRESPLY